MNITEIYTHPRFKTADMLMRRSIRMKKAPKLEDVLDNVLSENGLFLGFPSISENLEAERVAEALMKADGIPREVVTELDRLMDLTDEDLFPGDVA